MIENTSKNFILLESTNTQFNNVKINSNNIDVYNLGIAGFNKFNKNGKDENLLPLYLKKTQAQRQLEEKSISIETMQTSDLDHLDISKFDDFWNIDILKDELFLFLSIYKKGIENYEFQIPDVLDTCLKKNIKTIDVIDTTSTWYGMTYKEDKETVEKALRELTSAGLYPQHLWINL